MPFESIEVTVPTGRFSEFGANLPHGGYNFCGQHLKMPTLFKAQNGREIHQNTPVLVTGCATRLTRGQRLAKARKACRKKHGYARSACEVQAQRQLGTKKRGSKKR